MTARPFKLGLMARADKTGLGYQTRDYFHHLKPDRTMIVDISSYNGNQQFYDWYPEADIISQGFPDNRTINHFLDGLDVVLTAETPYNFELYAIARSRGIKTVSVENPEFYDYILHPNRPRPDMIILPSVWQESVIRPHAESLGVQVRQIHHPVDRELYPYRQRTGRKMIHVAGNPAAHDRNGTWDFLRACPEGTVITQSQELAHRIGQRYRHCKIYTGISDNRQIYELGDILVLPRRYGGNCLPLNEALSCGLPVIMPNIEPNNHLLPREWLVETTVTDYFTPRTRVDIYSVTNLADKLNELRDMNIAELSTEANRIADTISWQTLLPRYIKAIEDVCVS